MQFSKTKGEGPERISVEMIDPVMVPGQTRTAKAPITAKPSGLACEAELFLGPNETTKTATSGRIPFTSTGASQQVRLPITMPTVSGMAYHVYIDVSSNGMRFLAYQATEDVIIPGGEIGPITWE